MLTCLIAPLVLQQSPVSASTLISRMFARYSAAKTLSGTIRWTNSAEGKSVVTDTIIAYERPSKIHIEQRQNGPSSAVASLVSDGTRFAYSLPPELRNSDAKFLVEAVGTGSGGVKSIGDMYAAAGKSLLDRDLPEDVAIARTEDLKFVTTQLDSFSLHGKATIRGVEANEIQGKWRQYAGQPASGDFQLFITDEGDLLRYVVVQKWAPPPSSVQGSNLPIPSQPIEVTSVWDADIKVDTPVDPMAFKL